MTTVNEAADAIVRKFLDAWGDTSPVVLDNEDQGQPGTSWVRLSIRHSGANQETLGRTGNRRFERRAKVFVQMFLAQGTGRKTADAWTATVMGIFEGARLPGTSVCFGDVVPNERGPDGEWYAVTVEASFTYDEIK